VLSFDVEEHYRIEAAAGYECPADLKLMYGERMESATRNLLELLAAGDTKATFFIVAQVAETYPRLIHDIAAAGHEIGSHSYDHRRVNRFTAATFREDLKRSIDILEQAGGVPVVGFRAPTFSVTRATAWAVEVLIECGLKYDSSVFPVRHDRYGVPKAPRVPFWLDSGSGRIIELPLLTYRKFGQNLPVAGGGYFRLFPLSVMKAGIAQMTAQSHGLSMLYFHPWEFDPDQPRLPLSWPNRWRTYVGVDKCIDRLGAILARYHGQFRRAIDVVHDLTTTSDVIPQYRL
jgi:polysaccharide deacetylase family protein (PEP-CTERM system associated)